MSSPEAYEDMTRERLLCLVRERDAALGEVTERERRATEEVALYREELRAQEHRLRTASIALEESLERYADLYDYAPTPYLTLDSAGIVHAINMTGAELFGLGRKKIVRMPLARWVLPSDHGALLEHLRRCRAGDASVMTDLHLQLGDERVVTVQLVSRPSRTRRGKSEYRTTLVDLTERERTTEERQRLVLARHEALAASEAKTRFLAVLSHELRTPLTPILAAVEELEDGGRLSEGDARLIALVRRNVELEARLIDDLLDVTRIEHGKLAVEQVPVDLHALVERVIEAFADSVRAAGLRLEVALDAHGPVVLGDPTRLHQVLANLVSNAVRYTPYGGRVSVRTADAGAEVSVQVEDTGIGLDESVRARLFRPFEQAEVVGRRHGGLGLGLAISRGFVAAHGGTLTARSEGLGRGACFEVRLPRARASERLRPASRARAQKERTTTAPHARSVLVVEDHPDSAELLSHILTRAGFQVRVAGSVAEARESITDETDVLVTDIGLPDGSGLDLVRELRSKRVRAIALSGFGTQEDRQRSYDAGCRAHLTKPVSKAELVATIDRVCEEGSAA